VRNRAAGAWEWKVYSHARQIQPSVSPDPTEPWTYSAMDYTLWSAGQPSNFGGDEDCVNIWPRFNYEWNDERCSHRYCFVCEDRNE